MSKALDRPLVTTWSSYGHRFLSSGTEGYDDCLTCGAQYRIRVCEDHEPWDFLYVAGNGDEPMYCTGDTSMIHGYDRYCDDPYCGCRTDTESAPCPHASHECNCEMCT